MAFVIATAVVILTSCGGHPNGRIKATRPLTADEMRILQIARQAVATNDTWIAKAEFEVPQHYRSGWSIIVWRLPYTPGGHRLILIDEKGTVTAYHRGR